MPRILCIYMPFLATDLATKSRNVEKSKSRSEAGAACILLTRPQGTSTVVAHASSAARACDVRPGLLLAEARARCPQAVILPHDAARDARTLEHLALWAQRFSPVARSEPPDTLLLDVSGCKRLFRGEPNIVRQAVAGLAEQGIRARAAIADTVGAAWAIAHAGDEPAVVAPPGEALPLVAGLPPAALRLEPKVAEMLDVVGVRTIGDLLMLPTASLPSRFGDGLVLRIRQMLGEAPEWIEAARREPVFAARMSFGPSGSLDVLLAALERVLATLCGRLAAGGVAARRLRACVYFEQRPAADFWIDLSRPSRDERHLRSLLVARLERVDLSVAACGLMVMASETAAWRPAQGDLFEPPGRADDESVAALLDRLASHLGGDAVLRAEPVDEHQPERVVRYVAVVGNAKTPKRQNVETGPSRPGLWNRTHDLTDAPAGPRPLVLFERPRPIRVMALVPDGPPTWFRYRDEEHVVARAAGPQRLETGWWRGDGIRRDYFRVWTTGGQGFWMFRDLATGEWRLHGSYE